MSFKNGTSPPFPIPNSISKRETMNTDLRSSIKNLFEKAEISLNNNSTVDNINPRDILFIKELCEDLNNFVYYFQSITEGDDYYTEAFKILEKYGYVDKEGFFTGETL